ncbi:hypothetical protein MMPV_008359 [Pyropia vietnamensis]
MNRDYDTLGVRPTATDAEVAAAFRAAALRHHPDRHAGSEASAAAATAAFQRISSAAEAIRAHRERVRRGGGGGARRPAAGAATAGQWNSPPGWAADGGGGGGGAGPRRHRGPYPPGWAEAAAAASARARAAAAAAARQRVEYEEEWGGGASGGGWSGEGKRGVLVWAAVRFFVVLLWGEGEGEGVGVGEGAPVWRVTVGAQAKAPATTSGLRAWGGLATTAMMARRAHRWAAMSAASRSASRVGVAGALLAMVSAVGLTYVTLDAAWQSVNRGKAYAELVPPPSRHYRHSATREV